MRPTTQSRASRWPPRPCHHNSQPLTVCSKAAQELLQLPTKACSTQIPKDVMRGRQMMAPPQSWQSLSPLAPAKLPCRAARLLPSPARDKELGNLTEGNFVKTAHYSVTQICSSIPVATHNVWPKYTETCHLCIHELPEGSNRPCGIVAAAVQVSPPQTGLLLHQTAERHLAPLCWPPHSLPLPQQLPSEGLQTCDQPQRPCLALGLPSRSCPSSPWRQLPCCL